MPSVRRFAGLLGISPNTVNKTHGELQREGILRGGQGRSSFVAEKTESLSILEADPLVAATTEELALACFQAGESHEGSGAGPAASRSPLGTLLRPR